MTAADQGEAREALAREAYRYLHPGPVNLPDSQRSRETDLMEADDAYRLWDEGRAGPAHVRQCEGLADWLLDRCWRPPADHAESAAERKVAALVEVVTSVAADIASPLGVRRAGVQRRRIWAGRLDAAVSQALADQGVAERDAETVDGAALIAAERRRQIEVEGYTVEHDREHDAETLTAAAVCYATPPKYRLEPTCTPRYWPWRTSEWKPTPGDRRRELVKAGALIAAALDRLARPADDEEGERRG